MVEGPTEEKGEPPAEAAVEEDVVEMVTGGTEGERELLAEAAVAEKVGVGAGEAEAFDCACLARFLAAAFVCQPHEHGLLTERVKKDPCWHLLIAAIAAKTSLFDGFWPLPVNTGRPSAKSMSCSAYLPIPQK